MTKPNRTDSEKSLDDGRGTSSSNSREAPHFLRREVQQAQHNDDEDSDDAEVKSHSDSGSRLRLDTDHHNIPDAVTYERDKKQKVSMYATFDTNAHQKLRKKSQSELKIDSSNFDPKKVLSNRQMAIPVGYDDLSDDENALVSREPYKMLQVK